MAHKEADMPVEAAASLFGETDDTTTDFFAVNLNDAQGENSSEQHSSLDNTGVEVKLFEAGPDNATSSPFPSPFRDELQPVIGADNHYEHNVDSQGQASLEYDQNGYQSQGWQDEQGQWHDNDYQNTYTPTYDYASQQQHPTDSYGSQVNYFPQQYDYTPQHSTDYVPPVPQSASQSDYMQRYAAQKPPQHNYMQQSHQPTYPNSYTAPQSTGSYQTIQNSYFPASPYTPSSLDIGQAVTPRNMPSKKDVTAYRPTTLNAYDPPVPTKSRSKARSNFSTSSTPYSHLTYSQSLNTMGSPPLPPQQTRNSLDAITPYSIATEQGYPIEVSHGSLSQTQGPMLSQSVGERELHPYETSWYPATESHKTLNEDHSVQENELLHRTNQATECGDAAYDPEASGFENSYTSSIHPTDTAVTLDPSVAKPSSENGYGYELDSQPFVESQSSTNDPSNTTPTPLDSSPAETYAYAHTMKRVASFDRPIVDQQRYDPYRPTPHSGQSSSAYHASATALPDPVTTTSWNPYASSANSITASYGINDKFSSKQSISRDPYAPSSGLHRAQSHQSELSYAGNYTLGHNYTDSGQTLEGLESTSDSDSIGASSSILTAPTYAPYAPSPSLLGTNDPLGRAAARVPVISFGFGGKLVSCFHSAGETSSGFDVSLTAHKSTDVQLRILHEVIPASAMDSSASSYPGPLFHDPEVSSISLARTVGVGTASNAKTKKAIVSRWLEERITEISSGVAYMASGSQERHNSEGKLVLVRLLKTMLDNDGQLSGSSAIEWAVRTALVPRLESERPPSSLDGSLPADMPTYAPVRTETNESPLAVYHLRPSALDRIQEFLLRGERRQACHYALDEKLWAHAMLIASSIDNQAWKEVVAEFLHSELAVKQPLSGFKPEPTSINGRESLRVAYSLFAGQGAAAVQELIPLRAFPNSRDSLLAPKPGLYGTPVSPNFPQPGHTSSVPPEALAKWNETAAIMAFSQTTGDSTALTALGDCLAANRWFEAAHACYLLSPRTSSLGGAGVPSVRVVLVGSESPSALRNFYRDLDVTIFSEIVEFALSLSPAKGQDPFTGLPHLQAYKLIRASHLAEMGFDEEANRYCEAIGSVIRASTRGSPFYTPAFIGELKNLSDRLTAAPQLDKTASWISSKLSKPSLDTIGSWLEGRFSKLIVGEGEDGPEPKINEHAEPSKTNYGPFSHYSNISSATTSASPSPSPTPHGFNGMGDVYPKPSIQPGTHGNSQVQIDRASSAMDHLRSQVQRASPVQRVASAGAATTTFAQASDTFTQRGGDPGAANSIPESGEGSGDYDSQEVTWWGSSSQDRSGPTPTAATFYKVDESETEGNFVSLMDSYSPDNNTSGSITTTPQAQKRSEGVAEEAEEDLGFGNTPKHKPNIDKEPSDSEDKGKGKGKNKSQKVSKPTEEKPEQKQQSSSWFGRWWGKSSAGPVKAKLGDEITFVYDKELGGWVNKKASGTKTLTPIPPPPPPSRPRTASPAPPVAKAPNGPPPARPASAAEMTIPQRLGKPPRIRSNLVPTEESAVPGSAPPSATSFDTSNPGQGLAPPSSIGRPKSSASKRNVRSRYVDILQQQGES